MLIRYTQHRQIRYARSQITQVPYKSNSYIIFMVFNDTASVSPFLLPLPPPGRRADFVKTVLKLLLIFFFFFRNWYYTFQRKLFKSFKYSGNYFKLTFWQRVWMKNCLKVNTNS